MPAKCLSSHSRRVCRAAFAAVLAAALALGGCAANPVTGKKELSLISTDYEIETGREQYPQTQQGMGGEYNADPQLTRYVRSVGDKLAAVSDRDLPYEFVIINDSTPNAWALPGGKIGINRGLLTELDNEAELAAVLAHEIVHAAARHSAKSMQRELLGGLALAAAASYLAEHRHQQYVVGAAALGLRLVESRRGRDEELEADYYGIKYMHAAGYDVRAAVSLQEKFVALSEGREGNWLKGLFATHPPSRERVAGNRAALAEFPPGGVLGRARYQQKVARLKARQRAYEQADEASRRSAGSSHAALRLIEQAIARAPEEGRFYGIKGGILAEQGRLSAAVQAYQSALARRDDYYENYLMLGLAYKELGQRALARRHLERSHGLLPTALSSYHLGELSAADGDRQRAKALYEAAAQAGGATGAAAARAFAALDIEDNPNAYFNLHIQYQNGQIIIHARNASGIAVRDVVVGIAAAINGEVVVREQTLGYLDAGGTARVVSGIFYRQGQHVEAEAEVLAARVDE